MRSTLRLLVCLPLAGCEAASHSELGGDSFLPSYVSFNTDPDQPAHKGYSAFDGNAHTYQLVAWVPGATDRPSNVNLDPILPSSLRWSVDDGFVHVEAYPDIDGAILLTTKRAGETTVKPSGQTLNGESFKTEAQLVISLADPTDVLPDSSACASCRNDTPNLGSEITPAQTAGYSPMTI